jgi:FtsZ-binding cell division protein ZapB
MQAVAEVRKVVGQLTGELEDLRSENSHHRSEVSEVARANKQLRAEGAKLDNGSRRWNRRIGSFQK